MARPCTGCGLTVDNNGYLAINGITSSSYPYTAHTTTPSDVYCDSGSNELWFRPWGTAWGLLQTSAGGTSGYSYAKSTSPQSGITTAVDITGATVTFTAVANRMYEIQAQYDATSTVGLDLVQIQLLIDRVASQTYAWSVNVAGAGNDRYGMLQSITRLTAGSHTIKMQASRVSGTGSITLQNATATPGVFYVKDIGPAS
jgi:hypothetical protein